MGQKASYPASGEAGFFVFDKGLLSEKQDRFEIKLGGFSETHWSGLWPKNCKFIYLTKF